MRAVVVALGKIGLPLAAAIARAGHEVVGCDIDPRVVELVNDGRPPFPGEAGLEEALAEVVGDGRLRAHDRHDAPRWPRAPTSWSRCRRSSSTRRRGRTGASSTPCSTTSAPGSPTPRTDGPVVVSVETTLPVGTTRGRVAPALAARSGLRAEEDFFCVFSPERVFSGRVFADLATYPKLVGGLSAEGEERGARLYEAFLQAEVWRLGSAEAAELTKLAETTYRDVNIAFANELARFADGAGVDVQRVIDAANSQPFSHIHRPGVAVGGHCIPVYPRFYLHGDPHARLPAVAREVNEAMPAYAVELLAAELGGAERLAGERVLVLGVAYRGNVKETAFSGAFALRDELARHGAQPLAADPLYDDDELRALGFVPWDGAAVAGAVLQADHAAYRDLGPEDLPGARVVVDGRRLLDPARFAAAGMRLLGIGHR